MEMIQGKLLGNLLLAPAEPGSCPVCSTHHPAQAPHNQQSLFYQYNFYNEHGRWPTWKDAMKHCDRDTKKYWSEMLKEMGVL